MSAVETFVQFLKNLEHQWDAFKKSENQDEKNLHAEFSELISLTLNSCLDFRNLQSNPQIDEYWEKIKIIISSLNLEESSNQSINNVLNTDKWNSNYGQWLLSGKLIGSSNRLVPYDNKLLYESDEVINARIESLMNLFVKTSNDDTGQLVLNVFETYRKFLVRDVKFQCKLKSSTIDKLINYYMIILCHRKCNDHLSSSIKLFPNHRKINYILNLFTQPENDDESRQICKAYQTQIAERFIEDLLQCEFLKLKPKQNIKNFNLFVQQLIDLTFYDNTIDDEERIERIILSANDMNVISDYYYLAATQLRLQMPNKYNLIIKLFSIGVSHDISYIQELKYSMGSENEIIEKEYRLGYKRIYLALVTLGCIIKDYALRRLCFQAASLCETDTSYCAEILRYLPELEMVDQGDNLNDVLLDVRYLLETFQYDIKDRTRLPETFNKYCDESFETLEYYSHTATLSDDLKPLEYPGVEKYMKRQAIEEKEHISQTSDLDKCLNDIADFNSELSNRFKKMRNLYTPFRKQKLPSDEEIDVKVKEILIKSSDFHISANGEIFCELVSIKHDDILSPYMQWETLKAKSFELNKENLFFYYDKDLTPEDEFDISSVYQSGTVPVFDLYYKGYSTYDIENIMLYTIMEKKNKFIAEEFAAMNKNRNVEFDDKQNPVHSCFLYLANKLHPEHARLMRLSSTLRRFDNPLEYNLDSYVFDATPGKYKYRHKNKPIKVKQEVTENLENGSADLSAKDNSMELDSNLPISLNDIKKEVLAQSPCIPQLTARVKKEKIPAAINLAGVLTFNTSFEIQHIFKIIQIEIAALIQKDVFIDTSRITDISSPHLVQCTSEIKSSLPIKIQKIRNGNLNPREIEREIKLPINVSGKLAIVLEFRDEIKYDEHFENPYIASTLHHRVMSALTIDHLTHNAKVDIDCIIDGLVSKIKCSFQGQKNYRPRKKVQKPQPNMEQINQLAAEHVSVIQPPPKVEIISQPISNNIPSISNIVMNVNSNVNNSIVQPTVDSMQNGMNFPHQNIQQPYPYPVASSDSINTIVTTQQYNVPVSQQYSTNMQANYTPSSCYVQSSDMPQIHSSVIQVPQQQQQQQFTNKASTLPPPQYQQQQTVLQGQEPFICNPNVVPTDLASPNNNRVKSKIEILKIEDVSPAKIDLNMKKISFSNPCFVPKDESSDDFNQQFEPNVSITTIEKPIKQEIIKDDELFDFEDAIQTTMLQSTVPKKHLTETRSLPNIPLPKSPPPLHYPAIKTENNQPNTQTPADINKESGNCQLPSPVQNISSPKYSPQMRPNVIKSPIPTMQSSQLFNSTSQNAPINQHEKFDERAKKIEEKPTSIVSEENDSLMKKKIDLTRNITELINTTKMKLVKRMPDVIDLTDDINDPSIDLTSEYRGMDEERKMAMRTAVPDITFIECDAPIKSTLSLDESFINERAKKRHLKRAICSNSSSPEASRKCKVQLVDVMKDMNLSFLKKDTSIRLKKVPPIIPIENLVQKKASLRNTIAEELPSEESPHDTYVDSVYDATFTIVCHNSVSYLFNDSYGDGIANVIDRYSKCKTNNNFTNTANYSYNTTKLLTIQDAVKNNFKVLNSNNNNNNGNVDSFNNTYILKLLKMIEKSDLMKPSYSDKNHLNFTKNMKNRKKFTGWKPKESNLELENEKKEKSIFDDEKNHKSLLYQMSYAVMNSIPGMNSLEFFRMPSNNTQRTLQIEVVHLKEIKTSTSTETSEMNDGVSNEPGNLLHNEGNNSETISNATTIHVHKIGQTSISHETESRTLQTSFGSIIKNTYPPATSRVVVSSSEIMKTDKILKFKPDDSNTKKISITAESPMKNTSNVKIIACSSHQQINDSTKNVNKNQTLINMLTQQVMVPTNSNRHYIITSATKSPDVKVENATGTSCTLTTNNAMNNTVRKTVTNSTGQSQLVQILNSPPTNFTMKSINVLSSGNATNSKPSQLMTVASQPNVDGIKTELPDSIKQQGVVQFICKTDGKIIHLTPICNSGAGITKKITYKVDTSGAKGPTILHHANQQIILNNQLRKEENPNILTIIQKQSNDCDKKTKNTLVGIAQNNNPASPISTRSVYEETYAKFIQTPSVGISTSSASDMGLLTISSTSVNPAVSGTTSNTFIQKIGKTVIQSSNQILPKFNQAFGKSIFSSTSINDQTKVTTTREAITRSVVNTISPVKITKNEKNEISFIESDSIEKPLPTLQSALQGNNLLYARPIGNGKLIASNNNNVLLTALRSNSNQTNNVRIITTLADSMSNTNRTIMTPVRISVPIQIPQLINSVRPQSPGNFRPQIVIAPAATTVVRPQSNIQNLNQSGSKLQSLLMGSQQNTTNTINHQQDLATDIENSKNKVEHKQKKTVDNSTLEQLREFDMVLEQVLERSSVTPNSVSSPPPDNVNHSSPRKQMSENKVKVEVKSSSVSIASISPSDSPTSSKSLSGSSAKTTPKLQEDEHTAQRILDILANYKEQVRNSPDLNNKPAPRRRANPPTNPPAKRKKISASTSTGNIKNSKQFGSSSDVMTDTMGSEEDSSCGVGSGVASTGSINNSPRGDIDDQTDVSMDNNFYMEDAKREIALSPQSSNSSVTTSPAHNKFTTNRRSLVIESKNNSGGSDSISSKSFIMNNSQSSVSSASSITRTSIGESVERLSAQSSTTAVLMPGNYILPMNVLKGGQHLAILSSNNGQKIIAVPVSQLTSPVSINNSSGTSIILQRYVNQMNEAAMSDKAVLTQTNESDGSTKALHFQQQNSFMSGSIKNHASTIFVKSLDEDIKNIKQENDQLNSYDSASSNNFVSDKTLITEIIQQQQQLSHNHPQHNFMIKLNEPSDPKSSSSIMFMGDSGPTSSKNIEVNDIKIKTEKLEYDGCIKEEIMDLNNENEMMNSPMLNTKMEVDENTSSNHDTSDADNSHSQKLPQFPSILSSCLTKQSNSANSVKNTRGFLIDPSSKILMYNDRKQTSTSSGIDKEIFNQKSFSEECADLGVDEPIASDLFPEADLLFDSGSPKFDQINPNDGNIQIKRELENGEVLLQMNYNNNMSEPWLNFDTEDELVDDSNGESSDDVKESGSSKNNF